MRAAIVFVALALFAGAVTAQQGQRRGDDMPQMEQMQQRMQSMQQMMERIQNTEDAAERQRLMREHMQTMHQSMMNMHQMMNGSMMGRSRGRQQQAAECAQGDTECQLMNMQRQQEMMGQRMGMMQQMMQQMMEHMRQQQRMGTGGSDTE